MNENRHDKIPSHNIDDLFRSAIEPLEESPGTSVWEGLEKDLDRYNIVSIKRKYNNLKKLAIALVLILSSGLIYETQTTRNIFKRNYSDLKSIDHKNHKDNLAHNKQEVNKVGPKSNLKQSSDLQNNQSTDPPVNADDATSSKNNEATISAISGVNRYDQPIVQPEASRKGGDPSLNEIYSPVDYKKNSSSTANIIEGGAFVTSNENLNRSLLSTFPATINIPGAENIFTNELGKEAINISSSNKLLAIKHSVSSKSAAQSIKLSNKTSPFSLSLIFSPDFTSRLVKEDWPINREDNRDEIRKSEHYGFSYSLGALVDYKLSKHWGIQSGFTVSRAVINISPKFIFARPDDLGDLKYKFNSSSGYSYLSPHTMSRPVFGDSLHAFGSTTSLLYLSIPVSVKYKIAGKKFDYYASVGAAANVLVKDKIETSLFTGGSHENTINRDIRGLKPVYYSALLGAGVSYKINRRLAVNFTPTARLALTSINKDAPVKSYQQSLGMVAGVQLSF